MRATETRNLLTLGLDLLDSESLVGRLEEAFADVPDVVASARRATTAAVDAAVERLEVGGRLAYAGCGTPGWLVEADAAELAPTFGFPPERLAVVRSRAAAASPGCPDEDSAERGGAAARALGLGAADVLVAVASSGSTRFTLGAATSATQDGALTIAVANVPGSPLAKVCAIAVELLTGAEPVAGSTRMRAGLAQRLWLTVFSTAVMTRLGLTHDNLMVNVAPVLAKLRQRRLTILADVTGLEDAELTALLDAAGDDLRVAIVMAGAAVDRVTAERALAASGGRTRAAIESAGER